MAKVTDEDGNTFEVVGGLTISELDTDANTPIDIIGPDGTIGEYEIIEGGPLLRPRRPR